MTGFDYAALGIIGFSIIMSMMRGAVREILALASWVLAIYVARTYAMQLLPLMPADIPSQALKLLAVYVIVFLSVLLITSLLSIALSSIIKKIGLNWVNRIFGALFGLARGLLIVCVLVFLTGFTSTPKTAVWTNAMFSAPLEALVTSLLHWLPPAVTDYVKYD